MSPNINTGKSINVKIQQKNLLHNLWDKNFIPIFVLMLFKKKGLCKIYIFLFPPLSFQLLSFLQQLILFVYVKTMLYICGMENTLTKSKTITLELTPEEFETLSHLWYFDVDNLQYEVEMQTKSNDPNGELEELTNLMLSAMGIQNKLNEIAKTLQ